MLMCQRNNDRNLINPREKNRQLVGFVAGDIDILTIFPCWKTDLTASFEQGIGKSGTDTLISCLFTLLTYFHFRLFLPEFLLP